MCVWSRQRLEIDCRGLLLHVIPQKARVPYDFPTIPSVIPVLIPRTISLIRSGITSPYYVSASHIPSLGYLARFLIRCDNDLAASTFTFGSHLANPFLIASLSPSAAMLFHSWLSTE